MAEFVLWEQVNFFGENYSVKEVRAETVILKPHRPHLQVIEVYKSSPDLFKGLIGC
jgi:hypothetical protein